MAANAVSWIQLQTSMWKFKIAMFTTGHKLQRQPALQSDTNNASDNTLSYKTTTALVLHNVPKFELLSNYALSLKNQTIYHQFRFSLLIQSSTDPYIRRNSHGNLLLVRVVFFDKLEAFQMDG